MTTPRAFLPFVAATLLLVACTGNVAPTSSASPSATPPASASPSPTGSATASPTGTATATSTPAITLPPSPTPSASATPEPTATPTPRPTPTVSEIVRFRREQHVEPQRNLVDCTREDFDGTIHLAWRLRNVTGATLAIDGPGVYDSYEGTTGEADVPFACGPLEHTYTLTTTGGPQPPASVTRTIRVAQPDIVDMSLSGDACGEASDTFEVLLSYSIEYATGVELRVDGELYASYSGKAGENLAAGTYSCANESQEYELTTTGGHGTPATETLTFRGYD